MQLCKCLNCFLKTHNKQLNQYCLYFILFLTKKKVLKNGLSSGHVRGQVKLTRKKHGSGHESTCFALGQKNRVRVRYFSGRVGLG